MNFRTCLAIAACFATACGPTNGFTGKVGGEAFNPKSAALVTGTSTGGALTSLVVVLSDQTEICNQLATTNGKPNGSTLTLVLTSQGSTGLVPPTPGEYRVESSGGFQARGGLTRTVGTATSSFPAKAGTVTLTRLDSGAAALAAGTFELTLGEALDKVSGTFSAPLCTVGSGVIGGLDPTDPCSRVSKCPNDPKPMESELATCRAQFSSSAKCSAELKRSYECYLANQICGSDGKTDGLASISACRAQTETYSACIQG